MTHLNILVGCESFRKLREEQCCYVDKTGLLEELLNPVPPMVSLITRPRRFGKTLTLSMLGEFFDIRRESRSLFEGLEISRNAGLCETWMNRHPVLFVSLKRVEGLSFSDALTEFREVASLLGKDHFYLTTSEHLLESEKEMLYRLADGCNDKVLLESALICLSRALHSHWKKQPILLVDEYDVPLECARQNGFYQEMMTFLRNMLGSALKTNDSLRFAVLTGCLRISKESIFTGLNNFACFSVSDPEFADKFGFTEQEVDGLLESAGLARKKAELKEWYDGYRFGNNTEVYCPWDVLMHLSRLQKNPHIAPRAYWNNTSGNAVVRSFIGRTDLNIGEKFETLLNGGCIETRIVESLTYDALHASEENLWSLLYLTGYLTRASGKQESAREKSLSEDTALLVIPNKEVRKVFADSIASWFADTMHEMDRSPLFEAFWNGDEENLSRRISRILLNTISYHDYREDFYHAVLTGMFVGSGYAVNSNRESGLGRPDILIKDPRNSRAAVVEVKHAASASELSALAEAGLEQIADREYDASVRDDYETVIHWGTAFFRKRCTARFRLAARR